MKRYLLSIILGVCALGILCTYYVYGSADHLPEYKLTTIQGDPQEGAGIELSGHYSGRMRSEQIEVNGAGSHYRSRETLRDDVLGARSWIYNYGEMARWIREHRQFMRGKDQLEGFYEDKEWLIYATGASRSELSVERLHLGTGEVKEYTTKLPVQTDYDYINVADVQRINDQLHVLVRQNAKGSSSLQYFHYVLNFDSGVLIRSEQITHWKKTKKDVEIEDYHLYNSESSNGYAVFMVRENKILSKSENSYSSEQIAAHLYMYSYQTGKLTALPDPKQQFDPNVNYYQEGEQVIYQTMDKNTLTLSRYNLATGTEERDYVSIKASEFGAEEIQSAILSDHRVYVHMRKGTTYLVATLDLSDGRALYVGEVSYEGPEAEREKEMKLLQLYNLNINKRVS
ncbi:hypothetical protein [Paenibacillus guangzhouensis]|uniref:hypothetical protein n=1 Tax=Paenibacillus guangzhouensis TaxID=1473112 RepID=UPI001266FA3E|nr:hypothetical protein [Paenibacillus guangzhouensis]